MHRTERLLDVLEGHSALRGELFVRWPATEVELEHPGYAFELGSALDHVDGHADRRAVVGHGALHGLADPPGGIRRELEAESAVELLHGSVEPDRALLDQVEEGHAQPAVVLGDRRHESQVLLDHPLLCGEIAAFDALRPRHFVGSRQQPVPAHLAEEELERVQVGRFLHAARLVQPPRNEDRPRGGSARRSLPPIGGFRTRLVVRSRDRTIVRADDCATTAARGTLAEEADAQHANGRSDAWHERRGTELEIFETAYAGLAWPPAAGPRSGMRPAGGRSGTSSEPSRTRGGTSLPPRPTGCVWEGPAAAAAVALASDPPSSSTPISPPAKAPATAAASTIPSVRFIASIVAGREAGRHGPHPRSQCRDGRLAGEDARPSVGSAVRPMSAPERRPRKAALRQAWARPAAGGLADRRRGRTRR